MNSSLVFFRPLHMAAVLGALCAGSACADMLVLSAEADGQYDYGIQLDPNHGLVVLLGDEITLGGLSCVTLRRAFYPILLLPFLSAQYRPRPSQSWIQPPLFPVSHTISALQVISSASSTGLVDYQIQTRSEGVLSGTIRGPMAAAPEPRAWPILIALAAVLVLGRSGYRGCTGWQLTFQANVGLS